MAYTNDIYKIAITICIINNYIINSLRHKYCLCHKDINDKNKRRLNYGYRKMESHEGYDEHGKGV